MSYRDNDRSDYGGRSSGGGSMRRSDGGGRSRGGPYSRDSGRDGGRDDRRREDRGGGYGGRDRRDRDGGHDRRGGGGGGGREDRGPSVFVGNIPWASTEEELTDLFSEYGKVTNFRLLMDRETNRPRGMGFCELDSKESCQSVIDALNGYEVHGRELRVDHARPRN
jgi:hypothetical protein